MRLRFVTFANLTRLTRPTRRRVAFAGTLVSAAALGVAFAACSSSSNPLPTTSNDSGSPPSEDSSTPGDAGADANAIADSSPSDGASEADAPPFDAGPFTIVSTIALAAAPSAMAFDPVTNTLYVALGAPGATGQGIAVIDGATDTLTSTIANTASVATYSVLALDPGAGLLYAAASSGNEIDVIDTASMSVSTTIPTTSATYAIQVDTFAHVAYVLGAGGQITVDGGTNPITPASLSVIDGLDASAAPIVIDDLATTPAPGLAVDAVLRRLYLCGGGALDVSNGTSNLASVDTLDTVDALAPVVAQRSFGAATEIGCMAGWGGAALATKNPTAVDFFDFLDAATVSAPTGFAATTALGNGGTTGGRATLFGVATGSSTLEVASVESVVEAGAFVSLPPTGCNLGAGAWGPMVLAEAGGGVVRAYASYGPVGDGGAVVPGNSVLEVSINVE